MAMAGIARRMMDIARGMMDIARGMMDIARSMMAKDQYHWELLSMINHNAAKI